MRVAIDLPLDPELLTAAVDGLVSPNRVLVRRGELPPLYESGVVYRREARDATGRRKEEWRTADQVLAHGAGDCEDLVGYRVAELQVAGEAARQQVIPIRQGLWHVVVRRGDGSIEDPSARLGMYRNQRRSTMQREPDATVAGDDDEPDNDDQAAPDIAPPAAPPPAQWSAVTAKDGSVVAEVKLPTLDGRVLRVRARGANKKAAMSRAISLAKAAANRPELRALMPPQAMLAVKALSGVVKLFKAGKLGKLKLPGRLRSLGRLFS